MNKPANFVRGLAFFQSPLAQANGFRLCRIDHCGSHRPIRIAFENKRLARDAIFKEDQRQLVVPISRGKDPAAFLVTFLRELIPPTDG